MSDLKLFKIRNGEAVELDGQASSLEKSLQTLIEKNLKPLLGISFLASEHSTGTKHRGRIDTLGLDENGCPVIIEYKRSLSENVINQGLFYLDWLMDHMGEFELLVIKSLGAEWAEKIDWTGPRLVCIANDFTRYDEHAVVQMNRNIELLRYKRFGEDLLLLELVNAVTVETVKGESAGKKGTDKTISEYLNELSGPLEELYDNLKAYLVSLGDDVQVKTLKYYVAFKRIKNFACVEVRPAKGCLTVYVKVDPDTIQIEEGYTRDVRKIGHFGTGDLEITIKNPEDFEKSKPLLMRSYEAN